MRLSRKDFRKFAVATARLCWLTGATTAQRDDIINLMADTLAPSNILFDRQRFANAVLALVHEQDG